VEVYVPTVLKSARSYKCGQVQSAEEYIIVDGYCLDFEANNGPACLHIYLSEYIYIHIHNIVQYMIIYAVQLFTLYKVYIVSRKGT